MKPKARSPGDNSSLSVGVAKDEKITKKGKIPFHIFMDSFRKDYRKKHPNDKASKVKKAACAKWRAMSAAELATFLAEAEKSKEECSFVVASNNSQERAPFVAEADKSKVECPLVVPSNNSQVDVSLVESGYLEGNYLAYAQKRLRARKPYDVIPIGSIGLTKFRRKNSNLSASFISEADKSKAECSLVVASNDSQERAPSVANDNKSKTECSSAVASKNSQLLAALDV